MKSVLRHPLQTVFATSAELCKSRGVRAAALLSLEMIASIVFAALVLRALMGVS